jgi:hypothetical protein
VMPPEPVIVYRVIYHTKDGQQDRYFDSEAEAERHATWVRYWYKNSTPIVHALTVWPDAEEQESA